MLRYAAPCSALARTSAQPLRARFLATSTGTDGSAANGGPEPLHPGTKRPPKKPGFFRRVFSIRNKFDRILSPVVKDDSLRSSVAQVSTYGVYAVLGTTVLSQCGVDTTAILTGLGIGSIAAGFAVRDTMQSMVSSINLQLRKPFTKGDLITIGTPKETITGKVHGIDMNYVYLEKKSSDTEDISTVVVPVSQVVNSHIVVHGCSPDEIIDRRS